MKPSDIEVGKTYCNRGQGTTQRTVLAIGHGLAAPFWLGGEFDPNEPIVQYKQRSRISTLYLKSFAAWCGKEVQEDDE